MNKLSSKSFLPMSMDLLSLWHPNYGIALEENKLNKIRIKFPQRLIWWRIWWRKQYRVLNGAVSSTTSNIQELWIDCKRNVQRAPQWLCCLQLHLQPRVNFVNCMTKPLNSMYFDWAIMYPLCHIVWMHSINKKKTKRRKEKVNNKLESSQQK